jgi:hypothetical protein
MVAGVGSVGDTHAVTEREGHASALASISPGERVPFSSRIVSTVKSQRS